MFYMFIFMYMSACKSHTFDKSAVYNYDLHVVCGGNMVAISYGTFVSECSHVWCNLTEAQ